MLNFKEFVKAIKKEIENQYSQSKVDVHEVIKGNDISLTGITKLDIGSNISPIVYLDYAYNDYLQGRNFAAIVADIVKIFDEKQQENQFCSFQFFQFEKIKEKIFFKLINYEMNKKLLQQVPHFEYLDMAIVFYVSVDNNEHGDWTILVRNEHIEMWEITSKSILEIAIKNTSKKLPYKIIEMSEVMDMMGIQNCRMEVSMYVLTNEKMRYGASCILYEDVLKDFAQEQQSDLYILPSSIHEIIIVPIKEICLAYNELGEMVKTINRTQLEQEEILSDTVYIYSRKEKRVLML